MTKSSTVVLQNITTLALATSIGLLSFVAKGRTWCDEM